MSETTEAKPTMEPAKLWKVTPTGEVLPIESRGMTEEQFAQLLAELKEIRASLCRIDRYMRGDE